MDRACSIYTGEERLITGFWSGTQRQRSDLEDLGIDGKAILKRMLTLWRLTTYICRTAQLTSRRCILNIYPINILTEYFNHAAHSPFFFLFKMPFIS